MSNKILPTGPARTPSIEQELAATTKIKPKKGEDREKFLYQVWDTACDLPDDLWNNLTTAAADWVNNVTHLHNEFKKKNLPDEEFSPPDFPDIAPDVKPTKPAKTSPKLVQPVQEPVQEPEKPQETIEDQGEEEEEEEEEEEVVKAKPAPKAKAKAPKPEEYEEEEEEEEDSREDEAEEDPKEDPKPEPVAEPVDEPEVAKAKQTHKRRKKIWENIEEKEAIKPKLEPEVMERVAKALGKPPRREPEYSPGANIQGMVRFMMIEDPNMDVDTMHREISEKIGEVVSLTTIRASRSWFKAALRDLQSRDCLSKTFKAKLSSTKALG